MPFDYAIDPDARLITITGSGHATLAERFDCVGRLLHDQSIAGAHHILIDVCQVLNNPEPDEIQDIVSLIETLQAKFKGRVALLNTFSGHATVTNLIALSSRSCPDRVQAFLSENEARAWLGTGILARTSDEDPSE